MTSKLILFCLTRVPSGRPFKLSLIPQTSPKLNQLLTFTSQNSILHNKQMTTKDDNLQLIDLRSLFLTFLTS